MSKLTGAPDNKAAAAPPLSTSDALDVAGGGGTPPLAPVVTLLPNVGRYALLAASKESVATELLAAAKRRVMTNPLNKKDFSDLLETVRRAAFAEGYAQAKLDLALGRAAETRETQEIHEAPEIADDAASKAQKLEILKSQAAKAEEEEKELYVTKTTVSMVKTIALDYLKNVAPKIVGPTEIIKNSKKQLGVQISFGTLNRAMIALVETGEIERIEKSRWRFKSRTDMAPLRSVR